MSRRKVFLLTSLSLLAFAANSLLCRQALRHAEIDAASFTLIRIASGAAMLWLINRMRKVSLGQSGSWVSALALFTYAAAFSFAYLTLPAGTGALLLFGAVQATMILWGVRTGERVHALQIGGLALALFGLVVLVLPGLSAPSLSGSILMLLAGVAWGAYSLRGKTAGDPIAATAGNFVRAVPFALVLAAAAGFHHLERSGILYSVLSGAIASGLGYVIWYSALPRLRATSAATVQLSVPVLAAGGGMLLFGEPLTLRFILAALAVLGGIALVVLTRSRS